MGITTVRKNLHPHKKVRKLNLRNTRPEITQMIRLENQTPYPIRDLINMIAYSMSTGFTSPPRETISWNSSLNWLPVLTNPHTPVRFGYSVPAAHKAVKR